MPESETRKGIIDHIIYRNEENGYTVFVLIAEGKELTCVGFFQSVNAGESIEVTGRSSTHVSYGEQFKVESYAFCEPETDEAVMRYLGSGAIKGIGMALAGRIVKYFGEDTLRILEEEPERLAEVKGISKRKAVEIARQADDQRS
ncbi:MAG: helix-hairpin-helix domain-containing protein, partial [Lachnospiraceae bacterium]|nr:helix-hairpin-helix domain-containing protein [Lachnospiraceae bacterium]